MKLRVTNLTSSEITILGLPHGGLIPANDYRDFKVSRQVMEGYDGARVNVGEQLVKLFADGDIDWCTYPETGDYNDQLYTVKKHLTFTNMAGGANDYDMELLPDALPIGIYGVYSNVKVTELFAGGGAGSATISIGYTGALTALHSAEDVFTGASLADNPEVPAVATAMNTASTNKLLARLACNVHTHALTTGAAEAHVVYGMCP